MWIFRWLAMLLVIFLVTGFALQNLDRVDVTLLGWHSGFVPLFWVIFASFAAGVVLFFIVSLFFQVKYRREIHRYKKEIDQLKAELDRVRIITLEEGLADVTETGQDSSSSIGRGSKRDDAR